MLGGYVVEKMIFGDDMISTGPSSDLKNATKVARDMVTRYGMSDKLGPRTFGEHEEMIFLGREIHEERDYSDKTAEQIDNEVGVIISEAYKKAEQVLAKNKAKLEEMVGALMKEETIEQDRIKEIMGEEIAKDVV